MYHINPHTVIDDRIVIAMVGLPARGKSYISKAIVRYLTFLGCPVKLFNAGNKRRDQGHAGADASFFDPNNAQAKEQKELMAMETLDELLAWLQTVHGGLGGGCACGIFDATNTTRERRAWIAQQLSDVGAKLIFIESICRDEKIVLENILATKVGVKDYEGVDTSTAVTDFEERIRKYEEV